MTLFSLFENGVINCFFGNRKQRERKLENQKFQSKIERIGAKYNICVLPVMAEFEIENLYPVTDQVHKWNILIVGKDKTYIHANIYDLDIPEAENLPNHKGANVLGLELNEFFDPVFDKTLDGKKLQMLIVWRKNTYLVNTYPLTNQRNGVVGAIMFIRAYDLMPNPMTASSIRNSNDFVNAFIH